MFIFLLQKLFAVDENNVPKQGLDITQIRIESYKDLKLSYMTKQDMYESLLTINNLNAKRQKVLLVIKEGEWNEFVKDYCHFLGLTYQEYLLIVEHSKFCTQYIDNFTEEVMSLNNPFPIMSKNDYGKAIKKIRRNHDIFPIEFHLSNLTKQTLEKIKYFKLYSIYEKIKNLQFEYYKKGEAIPQELQIFSENDQTAKLLYDESIYNKVKKVFKENHKKTNIFEMNEEEYLKENPYFYLDKRTMFKYNLPLAKALKKRGYNIHE